MIDYKQIASHLTIYKVADSFGLQFLKFPFYTFNIIFMKNSFFFFLFILVVASSCTKENEAPAVWENSDEKTLSFALPEAEPIERFYIDEVEVHEPEFGEVPANYYLHSVISKEGNREIREHYQFSSRRQYERWGDSKGWAVSTMNQMDDRIEQLAINMGVTPNDAGTNVPDSFVAQAQDIANGATANAPAFLCYLSMRLSVNMCDPDASPGAPWACSGSNFSLNYASPSSKEVMTVLNNRASAWIPQRALVCSGNSYAHLKAYDKALFIKKIGTITVCVTCTSDATLFVPFNGIYAAYNDKISSFITWGSSNP